MQTPFNLPRNRFPKIFQATLTLLIQRGSTGGKIKMKTAILTDCNSKHFYELYKN